MPSREARRISQSLFTEAPRGRILGVRHGIARLEDLPISQRLLQEMHAVLMEGARGAHRDPGEFRRIQNWIGPPGAEIGEATYVPPPPGEISAALDALERYIHQDTGLPPLMDIALVHYQVETIHPFLDGNGRIGRLLITLMLIERDLLPEPLLYSAPTSSANVVPTNTTGSPSARKEPGRTG